MSDLMSSVQNMTKNMSQGMENMAKNMAQQMSTLNQDMAQQLSATMEKSLQEEEKEYKEFLCAVSLHAKKKKGWLERLSFE